MVSRTGDIRKSENITAVEGSQIVITNKNRKEYLDKFFLFGPPTYSCPPFSVARIRPGWLGRNTNLLHLPAKQKLAPFQKDTGINET